jgi:hypothetical protein
MIILFDDVADHEIKDCAAVAYLAFVPKLVTDFGLLSGKALTHICRGVYFELCEKQFHFHPLFDGSPGGIRTHDLVHYEWRALVPPCYRTIISKRAGLLAGPLHHV